ncbi:GNAT family N-acetyltransferase [Undibacterium pigrum]|uniref:Ribosomal protein S18 acetylase RimI-like enzyme n=1 Tax=Undibacterium pigrum TaxID=401470 RepID=A0A318IWI5_9BURK|nr:GNAT family N-acetyltransferase [Undibacterium pigrum]PXX38741.1 ribosomal protein S18 acetylase RimI-like enzyme [Undibacterium pigrum]
MTITVQLRPATQEDALCLSVLATQVFLDTYATTGIRPAIAKEVLHAFSVSAFASLLDQHGTFIYVAERDGHLLGFSQFTLGTRQESVTATHPVELDRLYVQEPFTRMGLGSQLLHASETSAVQRGAEVMWLTPWVHNARALKFYSIKGYADVGSTSFLMDGEAHENRVLCKQLS